MPFRRGPFVDLVERQLELFLRDHAGLVRDVDTALRAYDAADRDEAEARYGDYLDLVATGQDELVDLRETYAATLDDETAEEYRAVFNRIVRRRLPRFALELD